ncbi:MAG: hypothetical protein DBY36_05285 [Clostridiales bacterium]|nr:MAG: hypothetical protein DBY36_05285 [Clostridiales bacterium]
MKSKNRRLLVCALLCALALLSACADRSELDALREENERLRAEVSGAETSGAEASGTEAGEGKSTVSLVGKTEWFDSKNISRVSSLQFSFANHTDKVVKGVQGELIIMNMFGDTLYEGMLSVDGLRIEPGQTGYRQVTDYGGYNSEFSPSFDDYTYGTCRTIYNLSAEDMSIDFQLTALAYADGSFERFD